MNNRRPDDADPGLINLFFLIGSRFMCENKINPIQKSSSRE